MHHHYEGFFHRERCCGGRGHGRHRGLRGFLGGAIIGDGEFGWHAFRTGRKFDADDLQLIILSLLGEKPAHGYEIIKALGERSGGFYNPSPGMVYPALTYLEELGYASVEAEGTRKLYSITDAGREHLAKNRGTVDTILSQLKWVGEKMEHVRQAFSGEREDWAGVIEELRETRKQLKALLIEARNAAKGEQARIAEILKRAIDEIRGK